MADSDPDALPHPAPSSSGDEHAHADASDVDDARAGRAHYAAVGKSTLRQNAPLPHGPSYRGKPVSRDDLDASDSDSDSDVPSAHASAEESDGGEEDLDEDDEADGGEEDLDDHDEADGGEEDLDDHDHDDADSGAKPDASAVRSMFHDTQSFTATLAAGVQADVAKGQAVKAERKTFDTLLNTRIRLQKALVSTNSMAVEAHKDAVAPASSIHAAEAAALALLNNLTDLRLSLEEARTGSKRKRAVFDSQTPSSDIWKLISTSEKAALPHRKAVLERWSTKTRPTTVTNTQNRLNASATQTLTQVLDSQLQSSHLVTRTQTPRSCAPLQANLSNKGSQPDPAIYDDADFYGLLLKELLEQRSADNAAGGAAEFVVQAPWQVAREAKTKKVVDTKATKGRRLRYTVQEKLQNFMAPEDRGEWGQRQRDDLFSSLFGQRMALADVDDVESDMDEHGVDAEEAGLMLFRS
ncbi:rRNA-processing protein bfr2 [Pleosporales sp. CAS-2024a]